MTYHYEVQMNGLRIHTFSSTKLNEEQLDSFNFDVIEIPQYIPQLPDNPLSTPPQSISPLNPYNPE